MSAEYTVELFRTMLSTALVMVMPMLLTAMVIGLAISLLQAVTSIQEQTLAFVPKLVGVVLVLMLLAFWLIEKILSFTTEIFNRVAGMGG
ncbi:MAG: flagellar biosynthesis protein FliQ [Puniceicoccaceae bacterium]